MKLVWLESHDAKRITLCDNGNDNEVIEIKRTSDDDNAASGANIRNE